MKRKLNHTIILALLLMISGSAYGDIYNCGTIEREQEMDCPDNTQIPPYGQAASGIAAYLVSSSGNSLIVDFINCTGAFADAAGMGLPNIDMSDKILDNSDCELTFNRSYFLTRTIDDENYILRLTEHYTVRHRVGTETANYVLDDNLIYGKGTNSIPPGSRNDYSSLPITYPCGGGSVMTYQDQFLHADQVEGYLVYQRQYKLFDGCDNAMATPFATITQNINMRLMFEIEGTLPTIYVEGYEMPAPYTTINQLIENGMKIQHYPSTYYGELDISSVDVQDPDFGDYTTRTYTITNPYDYSGGPFSTRTIEQLIEKTPTADHQGPMSIRVEEPTLDNQNLAKMYLLTSSWDEGCPGYEDEPWEWYYIHMTKYFNDGGGDVYDIEFNEDDFNKRFTLNLEGTLDSYYEILIADTLGGDKYDVHVLAKNGAAQGFYGKEVYIEDGIKIEKTRMKLYASPIAATVNKEQGADYAYVPVYISHLINLDDYYMPVYSGTCDETTYDNFRAKVHPASYSICHEEKKYLPFKYSWELKNAERTEEEPTYNEYGWFAMNYDHYTNEGFSIGGEQPQIVMTKTQTKGYKPIKHSSIKLLAESEEGDDDHKTKLVSEVRDITISSLTCSVDPNEIYGPAGYGEDHYIATKDRIGYRINFENDTTATSAAGRVVVHCPLHHRADSTTVRLENFGFGDFSFEVPSLAAFYDNRITETEDSLGVWVDVTAGLDMDKNEMYWIFQSIDPETGVAPIDTVGFLPVNVNQDGKGEGYVTFSVMAIGNTVTGDTIAEQATIIFDENEPIETNIYTNKFDGVAPTSAMAGDTTGVRESYYLNFRALGIDDVGGSGIKKIDVYVSVDNMQYVWAATLNACSDSTEYDYGDSLCGYFKVGQGSIYDFISQATDNVGNVEPFKSEPEFTYENLFPPTDIFLTNRFFKEDDEIETKVGDFYAIDNQSTNDFKYALVEGSGGLDNDKFIVDSCFLFTNYDFRCKDVYDFSIRVECTDNTGETLEKVFQLHAVQTETPPVTVVDTTLCYGVPMSIHGKLYSEDGTYYDTLSTALGCDSVVMLSMRHYEQEEWFVLDTFSCIGSDFITDDFNLTWNQIQEMMPKWTESSDTTVTYEYDRDNPNGCSTPMRLNLTVYPVKETFHHIDICANGVPFIYGDTIFSESCTKDVYFKQKFSGCDSIVTVELNVYPTYKDAVLEATICSNEEFELFGNTFTEEGVYQVHGETAIHHCDSLVTLTLNVKPISERDLEYTVCPTDLPQDDYYGFNLYKNITSGLYYDTLDAKNGCDSIVTLDLTVREAETQLSELADGWNWYSTYLDLDEINGLQALEDSLGEKGLQIKSHKEGFVVNSPGMGWVGSLTAIENERMYMIQTNDSVDVDIFSCLTTGSDHPITVVQGWNWIGYVSRYTNSTVNALGTLTPHDGDIIKSYDQGFAAYYEMLGGWFGSLTQMRPGVGYMYYSNNDNNMTLIYPDPAKDGGSQLEMLPTHWNASIGKYPTNMTFIGKITIDNIPTTTDNLEVGVFCDGEVRGSGRAILMEGLGTYRLFVQVYGDNGDELTFRLFDHKTGREHDAKSYQKVYFADNASYGSIHDPYPFKFYTKYTEPDNDDVTAENNEDGGNGGNVTNEEGMSHELTLVPNPAKSSHRVLLYCDFTAEERDGLVVEVFNDLGVKIQHIEPTRYPVQLNEIEHAGNYMVRVTTGTGRTLTKKLVVTR